MPKKVSHKKRTARKTVDCRGYEEMINMRINIVITFLVIVIVFLLTSACSTVLNEETVKKAVDKAGEMKEKADHANEDLAGKVIAALTDKEQENTQELQE